MNVQINAMKIANWRLLTLSALVTLLFGAASATFAQPVLVVNPASTSNNYTGVITLNITGLNTGEKVTVQRWIDLNGNGVIDPGEPMMDAFKLTDNDISNALIGGATNVNVPFDHNATNGAITATLSFAGNQAIENMVGHFVYRIVSPTNNFTPVTATFIVTNAALGQSVSGIVYSNGLTPLPYAVVVAQDQQANNPTGSVVADASGHYFLTLPPSSYNLIAGVPNYYFDQSLSPSVTLTNGMAATNDLSVTNGGGGVTISGSVYDASSSNGIGGLLLLFQSGNLFEIGFTDTNGNYSAAVTPSMWKIELAKERLPRRAYVNPQQTLQVDTTTNSVSGVNIALPKGNALFYGRITDNLNVPFANAQVETSTSDQNYDAKGLSDPNGNFAVAVLGGITNEQWFVGVSSGVGTPLANYVLSQFSGTAIASNQAIRADFTALPATAMISGHVTDNFNNPVVGVGLYAVQTIGTNTYQSLDGTTDNSGNYSLAVASGQWSVQFLVGNFDDTLDTHGYTDLTMPHNVSIPPTNVVLNLTVYPIGTPLITMPQRISSTQFGFNVAGASNVTYTVQYSTNLSGTNWFTLESFQMTNNPTFVIDPNATNSARFYRVQKN